MELHGFLDSFTDQPAIHRVAIINQKTGNRLRFREISRSHFASTVPHGRARREKQADVRHSLSDCTSRSAIRETVDEPIVKPDHRSRRSQWCGDGISREDEKNC